MAFDAKSRQHKLRMDAEVENNLSKLQRDVMHKHVRELHAKLRAPKFSPHEESEDMGETPAEERSERDQESGMPSEGHTSPEQHAHILEEMFDTGEGEHDEEKGHEMEKQHLPGESAMDMDEQKEPVYEEEHDSEHDHLVKKHKKRGMGSGMPA